jgi:hypothetical protein
MGHSKIWTVIEGSRGRVACITVLIATFITGCSRSAEPQAPLLAASDLAAVHATLDEDHPGRGIADYAGNPVTDVPSAYAMVLLAEVDRRRHPAVSELPDLSLVSGHWLLDHADENRDGTIGWGLPVAWDAYGDGSENPVHTGYAISTAIAIHALLDWMDLSLGAPRERILETVAGALLPYVDPAVRTPSGLLPYSLQQVDRRYDTFNSAAYLAGQMQRFSKITSDAAFAERLRSAADATMRSLLWHRRVSPETGAWYWSYSVQEEHPNDLGHASFILEGIRAYIAHGGSLAGEFFWPKAVSHLKEFYRPQLGELRAWPRFWHKLDRPARLYDVGMGLHLACTEVDLKTLRSTLISAIEAYRAVDGSYLKFPAASGDPLVIKEYEAYLYRGMASCLNTIEREGNASVPASEPREVPLRAQAETEQRALAQIVRGRASVDEVVPFVELSSEAFSVRVRYASRNRTTRLSVDGGPWVEMPEQAVPVTALRDPKGGVAVFTRTMPDNRLRLLHLDDGNVIQSSLEIRHKPGTEPMFRAARFHAGTLYLVYYDNLSLENHLVVYSRPHSSYVRVGDAMRLPLLREPPGGTYEMIPPIFLIAHNDNLHILGGSLHTRLSTPGPFVENRIANCLRIIEAIETPEGPVALCASSTPLDGSRQFLITGPPSLDLPVPDTAEGVPWNLRYEGGRVALDHASSVAELRTLFMHDMRRGQQRGWFEFGTNNEEGRIPWSQIYYLNGFLDLLLLSRRDQTMLLIFEPLLADIRRRLDLELSLLDWHWRSGRYRTRAFTVDRSPALFAVQTSRLLLLMDRYLREVPQPIPLPSYADLRRAVRELEDHIEVLATEGEPANWIPPGKAYLRWPRGSKFSFDGVGVPFNHQNEWAYSVIATAGKGTSESPPERAAVDILEHFLARVAPGGHLPASGQWDYWWGTAYDGWTEADQVSVNRPNYGGDKHKAWISFRSIDVMAMLAGADRLSAGAQFRLIESAITLVCRGDVYPFVSYELLRQSRAPAIAPVVANAYLRVSSPWELQNAAWAYLRRAQLATGY